MFIQCLQRGMSSRAKHGRLYLGRSRREAYSRLALILLLYRKVPGGVYTVSAAWYVTKSRTRAPRCRSIQSYNSINMGTSWIILWLHVKGNSIWADGPQFENTAHQTTVQESFCSFLLLKLNTKLQWSGSENI